jgi:hypothetical protein
VLRGFDGKKYGKKWAVRRPTGDDSFSAQEQCFIGLSSDEHLFTIGGT